LKKKQGETRRDSNTAKELSDLQQELTSIKHLLVLLLAKQGSGSREIAMALGTDDSTVRRMISFRSVERTRISVVADDAP
jgi:hypothetical protein